MVRGASAESKIEQNSYVYSSSIHPLISPACPPASPSARSLDSFVGRRRSRSLAAGQPRAACAAHCIGRLAPLPPTVHPTMFRVFSQKVRRGRRAMRSACSARAPRPDATSSLPLRTSGVCAALSRWDTNRRADRTHVFLSLWDRCPSVHARSTSRPCAPPQLRSVREFRSRIPASLIAQQTTHSRSFALPTSVPHSPTS
jgi:hypothetical protein